MIYRSQKEIEVSSVVYKRVSVITYLISDYEKKMSDIMKKMDSSLWVNTPADVLERYSDSPEFDKLCEYQMKIDKLHEEFNDLIVECVSAGLIDFDDNKLSKIKNNLSDKNREKKR